MKATQRDIRTSTAFAVRLGFWLHVHTDGTLELYGDGLHILYWRTWSIVPVMFYWQGRAHRAPGWMRN